MSITSNRFKLTTLASAMLAVSSSLYAQENKETAEDEGLVEEVVLTGIRAAIQRSMDDKREAQNIVDTINAEDIGKTTDQNIADALSMVTGVSLQTRDGEGTTISVRGASPNQNTITMNGVELTSSEINQAFDLSSFSADILSKLEVIKTPSADHIEGSLGGGVTLSTRKPLDESDNVLTGTLQGRYGDLVDEVSGKIQVGTIQKLFDDTFGFSLFFTTETNEYRKDELNIDGYQPYISQNSISSVTSISGGGARDQHGDVVNQFAVVAPGEINFRVGENSSNRDTLNLGLQFRPSDTTDISFDATYSDQDLETKPNGVGIRSLRDRPNNLSFNKREDRRGRIQYIDPQEDWWAINSDTRTLTKALSRVNDGGFVSTKGGTDNTNVTLGLNLDQDFSDSFRANFSIGYASTESKSKPNAYLVSRGGDDNGLQPLHGPTLDIIENPNGTETLIQFEYDPSYDLDPRATPSDQIEPIGFDCTDSCRPIAGTTYVDLGIENAQDNFGDQYWDDNTVYTRFNPHDTAPNVISYLSETINTIEDTNASFAADFDWDIDALGITTIEFGARHAEREKEVDTQSVAYDGISQGKAVFVGGNIELPGGTSISRIPSSLFITDEKIPDDFMETMGYPRYNVTQGWNYLDPLAAKGAIVDGKDFTTQIDPSQSRKFEIDTNAAYLKTNFSFLDDRLTGDIGVRYVKTELKSSGFAGFQNASYNQTGYQRIMQLGKFDQLADRSLKQCMPVQYVLNAEGERAQAYVDAFFQRVDGHGYATNVATLPEDGDTSVYQDPSQWVPIDNDYIRSVAQRDGVDYALVGEPCHDPDFASAKESVLAGEQMVVPGVVNPDNVGNLGWDHAWRYGDPRHTAWVVWSKDLTTNMVLDPEYDTTEGINPVDAYLHNGLSVQTAHAAYDTNKLASPTSGDHSYSNILLKLQSHYGSLNLLFRSNMGISKRGIFRGALEIPLGEF